MVNKNKKLFKLKFKKKSDDIIERIPYRKVVYFSVTVNLLMITLILLSTNRLPPEIPLYYGLPEGVSQLAERIYLTIPSLIVLGFIILNTIIIIIINNVFLKKALVTTCLALSMFSFITTVKIMFLVGSF